VSSCWCYAARQAASTGSMVPARCKARYNESTLTARVKSYKKQPALQHISLSDLGSHHGSKDTFCSCIKTSPISYSLQKNDWISFLIAIRSFLIAIRSLLIAIRSLLIAIRSLLIAIRSLLIAIANFSNFFRQIFCF
jgi:hypothetical protein